MEKAMNIDGDKGNFIIKSDNGDDRIAYEDEDQGIKKVDGNELRNP